MNSLRFSGSAFEETCSARHGGPADHEHVDARVDHGLGELLGALRRQRSGHRDAGLADLAQPLGDQFALHRLGVDLLHPTGGLDPPQLGHLVKQRCRVVVPRPDALEVEHAEPAELAERDRGLRRHHRVHRRGQDRQFEAVGVDLPGDADLLGVARAPRGHDRDVVEAVGAAGALGATDLEFRHGVRLTNGSVARRFVRSTETSNPSPISCANRDHDHQVELAIAVQPSRQGAAQQCADALEGSEDAVRRGEAILRVRGPPRGP